MADYSAGAASDADNRKDRFLMVVDNDSDSLSYLSVLLHRFNYPAYKAMSAQEALETAMTAMPFLVIMSLHLPDMPGFDFMQQLKDHPSTSHIPLIAVSRKEDAEARKRCLDLGAVGYLYHPVDAETLYRVVQVAVEKNPRSCMRVRTNQLVKVCDVRHDSIYDAHTLDLSERGMFLRTISLASVHARLSLQLDLDGRIIPTEAEVLYNCREGEGPYQEAGVGLKFNRIEPKDQEFLRKFIKAEVMRGITSGNA